MSASPLASGHHGTDPADKPKSLASGYHGLPAMKPSPWMWQVPSYVALVGAGGAGQILAALARGRGTTEQRSIVRNGRILGLASTLLGAPLLIADLKTPHRFYNMLRIWRPTSPMSIGSWLLVAFGVTSGATVAAELLGGTCGRLGVMARRGGDAAQVPAALLGAGMATYTGALLSATSVPLWQAAPGLLTARFGASAFASGAATLSLAERVGGDRHGNAGRLDLIAAVATAAGLALSIASERTYARLHVDAPLEGTPEGLLEKGGSKWLGQVLPLALLGASAMTRRRSPRARSIAGLAIIGGSFALRHGIMAAEKRSARSPRDYLELTSAQSSGRLPQPVGTTTLRDGGQRASAMAEV